tara:strand:+ start:596 stop:1096 length:501 start_codon:yes stop_codon:yes gene_type:complete
MLEKQAKIAYIGIGSNLGNKKKNIELSKYLLEKKRIKVLKVSNMFESLSWPNTKNPKFINIVIKIKTTLTPLNLMKACLDVEKSLGRKRFKKNQPRTCDIDVLDYDRKIINQKNLKLPHPRMHTRNFVLLPFFEINKTWIHPLKKIDIKKLLSFIKESDLIAIKLV